VDVKERPILFSAPMVRAILEGRKTQTRRVVDVTSLRARLPYTVNSDFAYILPELSTTATPGVYRVAMNPQGAVSIDVGGKMLGLRPGEFDFVCPYVEGTTRLVSGKWNIEPHGPQRLWVRETFSAERMPEGDILVAYRATCEGDEFDMVDYATSTISKCKVVRWKPAIHMPREWSRLSLEVTDVRVERLQDISEEDAKAEGLKGITKDGRLVKYGVADRDGYPGTDDDGREWQDWDAIPSRAFARLWDSINAKRATWDSNPWVWVVSFLRVETAAQAQVGT
jgi:hypothetical protein